MCILCICLSVTEDGNRGGEPRGAAGLRGITNTSRYATPLGLVPEITLSFRSTFRLWLHGTCVSSLIPQKS